jgi:hypothetical protein
MCTAPLGGEVYPNENIAPLCARLALLNEHCQEANANSVDRQLPLPAYARLEAKLKCEVWDAVEFNAVGQNPIRDYPYEFSDFLQNVSASPFQRSVYANLTWRS